MEQGPASDSVVVALRGGEEGGKKLLFITFMSRGLNRGPDMKGTGEMTLTLPLFSSPPIKRFISVLFCMFSCSNSLTLACNCVFVCVCIVLYEYVFIHQRVALERQPELETSIYAV